MLTIIDPLLSESDWHVRGFDSFANASLRLNASYQKQGLEQTLLLLNLSIEISLCENKTNKYIEKNAIRKRPKNEIVSWQSY